MLLDQYRNVASNQKYEAGVRGAMLAQFCHVTYRVDSAPTTNPGTTSYLLHFTADRDECIMSIKCTVRRSMIGILPDALMLSSV